MPVWKLRFPLCRSPEPYIAAHVAEEKQKEKKIKKLCLQLFFCYFFSLFQNPFRSNGPIGEMANGDAFRSIYIIYYISDTSSDDDKKKKKPLFAISFFIIQF